MNDTKYLRKLRKSLTKISNELGITEEIPNTEEAADAEKTTEDGRKKIKYERRMPVRGMPFQCRHRFRDGSVCGRGAVEPYCAAHKGLKQHKAELNKFRARNNSTTSTEDNIEEKNDA